MRHEHIFTKHVGLRTSFGAIAWVWTAWLFPRWAFPLPGEPWMWKCIDCGEQGYEVPA